MSIRKYKPEQIVRGKVHDGVRLLHEGEGLPKKQPLLYRVLNTSSMGTGPLPVTTEGITPFHFSTAVC